jgi:hypothetical protein
MSVVSFGSPEDYERMRRERYEADQRAVYLQSQKVAHAPIVPQPRWHPDSFENDPLVKGFQMDDGDFPAWSIPNR